MRRKLAIAFLVVFALLVGIVVVMGQVREGRAAELAVKYGSAPSKGEATLADRCIGVMREDYATTDDPRTAGMGPKTFALLAPKVCALGVDRGLVEDDGTMTEQSGFQLMTAVMRRMGAAAIQTLTFNELAVDTYKLAKPGKVTRWHRCVAMAYSGWDAQPEEAGEDARALWQRASRRACTLGIKRGIVPASGVPLPKTPAGERLGQLILETMGTLAQG